MYIVNRQTNSIESIRESTFSSLGFKERKHLQEWLESHPEALGEELLIIQKEFSGFNDTNERLDLLALDKKGNIVVIENKLDDTGRDATWQALKYASYCSTLTRDQIRDIFQQLLDRRGKNEIAITKLTEFFDNTDYDELTLNVPQSQRIILVAGNFRKEVTSTVLWLLNQKLRIQCFKATPYVLSDQIFLTVVQIIPPKDTEDYVISMVDKAHEEYSTQRELKERHHLRYEFWGLLLSRMKGQAPIYQNSSPSRDHWLNAGGTGLSGLSYSFVVTKTYVSVELIISKGDAQDNKQIFDEILVYKDEITRSFGSELSWERLDDKKMCRIAYYKDNVNVFNKEDWPAIIEFLIPNMIKLETAFREPIRKVKQKLNIRVEAE